MKWIKTALFLLLTTLSFSLFNEAKATHVMGSDIQWECIGKDTFKITVQVYRDCNGVNLSATPVTAYSNCGSKRLNTTRSAGRDITPVCDEQCTRCDSRGCSFEYGIEVYELTTTLIVSDWRKNGCCEVTLTWEQCCRNGAITTGAANQNFYVEAKLNICQDPCDNSPTFTGDPLAIICLGRDFIYNQGAQDKDISKEGGLADSLVYSWAEPMTSSTGKTTWSGNYAYNKPLNYLGFPKSGLKFPRGIHLDSVTGDIMFRPMKVEQTVMSIKIESYRNGKFTGMTRRDIQVIVIKCPDNNPPVISGINCKKPIPANFKIDACANETLCFTVCTSDKDKDDTVTIGWNAGIPGATFDVLNKGDKRERGRFCWTPTDADVSKFPYSFVVNAKDNACPVNGFAARSFQIKVKPQPKAIYDTLVYDCGDAYFVARKTGNVNVSMYQWIISGRVVLTKADNDTIFHHFKTPGEKVFNLTLYGANGCNNNYQDTVLVPKYINIDITNDTTVCPGSELILSGSVKDAFGDFQMAWGDSSIIYKNKVAEKQFIATSDTFLVAYVKDTQCSNSDTIFIKVSEPIDFTLDSMRICPSNTHTFKPTILDSFGSDTIKYTWSLGSNIISNTDSLIVGEDGLYKLQLSNDYNCVSNDSAYLHINPEVNWVVTQELCFGDSLNITLIDSGKYEWKDKNDNIINIGNNYNDTISSSKYFYVNRTQSYKGLTCVDNDSIYVRVKPLPEIKILKPANVCENDVDFTLDFNATPFNGVWKGNGISGNRFYPSVAKANADTPQLHNLYYTYKNPNTGCENIDSTYIIVKPVPKIFLKQDTVNKCSYDDNFDLNNFVEKPIGGKWYGTYVNNNIFEIENATSGIHEVIYQYKDNSGTTPHCMNYDTMYVNVIKVPTVKATKYEDICLNADSIVLDGQPNGGLYVCLDDTIDCFDPTNYDVGRYKLTYIYQVENSECYDTSSTFIKVNPIPDPVITTPDRVCIGDDFLTLTGNDNDFITKEWSSNRDNTVIDDRLILFNAGEGDITITYEVSNEYGCYNDVSKQVSIDPIKKVSFTNEVVCKYDTVDLFLTTENSDNVIWETSGDGIFLLDNETKYIPLGSDLENEFTIKVTTDNKDNVCDEASYESKLKVHPLPNVKFITDDIVCAPYDAIFYDMTTIDRGSIRHSRWDYGDGNYEITRGEDKVVSNYYGVVGQTDVYTVTLTATSDEGCVSSYSSDITTLLSPIAKFRPEPKLTTIINPRIKFNNMSEYLNGNNIYEWNFGDNTNPINAENAYYRYSDTGTFEVQLIATNVYKFDDETFYCSDTAINDVIVRPEILVFIPNAFSPDGKGIDENNVFKPIVNDVAIYSAQVFNRWGELMWSTENIEDSWDGTNDGVLCQKGVYLYVVKVTNKYTSMEYEFTGTVTLIR